MSKNRKRGSHSWDGARASSPPADDDTPCKAGWQLSGSKAVVLERADCCLACIKRRRSRWGKHPDKKPAYKNHRRNRSEPQWHSQDA